MMKMFERVAVICDHTPEMLSAASALRAVLEGFALHVDFHRLIQKRQVIEFFARPIPDCDYTVVFTHGDAGKQITFHVVDQKDGDYDQVNDWANISFDLTPENIPQYIKEPKGALISLACGGGREALARGFLGAGYNSYIGADTDYIDGDSVLMFAASLFYFLLAEDRDYAPRTYTLEEAVEQASALDPSFELGTRPFRCWSH